MIEAVSDAASARGVEIAKVLAAGVLLAVDCSFAHRDEGAEPIVDSSFFQAGTEFTGAAIGLGFQPYGEILSDLG